MCGGFNLHENISLFHEVAQCIGAYLVCLLVPLPLVKCIALEPHRQGKVDRENVWLLDANTRDVMQSE